MIKQSVNNTEVIVHSGYEEIGGNLVEIKYKKNRIILDLGISFKQFKKFYEWPFRTPKDADELIELGIVPKIEGLFAKTENEINAIFISHAHRDHSELTQYIPAGTNLFMGETCEIILRTRRDVYNNKYKIDLENDVTKLRTGFEISIDEITVHPIHVDHSIPGAYSYVIRTPDSAILYTGDYRLHGGKVCERSLTEDMIIKAKEYGKIDLFITEGTRFSDCSTDREIDVLARLNKVLSSFDGTILLEYSYLDIDRYESIIETAVNWNKNILFDYRHLIFLYRLYKEDPGLTKKISLDAYKDMLYIYVKNRRRLRRRVREIIEELENEGYNIVETLQDAPKQNVILEGFNLYIQDIFKTRPERCLAIHSTSEPYDEEIEISYEKLNNWLKALNAPSYRIHSSGHIHPLDLIKVYKEILPRDTLVIHSEYPDQVKEMLTKSIIK